MVAPPRNRWPIFFTYFFVFFLFFFFIFFLFHITITTWCHLTSSSSSSLSSQDATFFLTFKTIAGNTATAVVGLGERGHAEDKG